MSTSRLCPCPACNRHIKTDAGVCPFCEAALPESFCEPPTATGARPRLSRAARLLAGATLVGVSACSSTETQPVPVVHYGAPIPVDASTDTGAGAGGSTGADGGPGTVVALYGGPPIKSDAGG
jgi:hypothetical protein